MVIFPSNAMLRRIGIIVKGRREDIHMSQVELARGICTQTTISTLENNGCFNSWHIIPQIFERLKLDLDDLENDCHYRYGENQLRCIERNLLTHNFKRARKKLNKIKQENLETKDLIGRYHCDSGYLLLFIDHNYDEAITEFQLVIDKYQTPYNQLTVGWSYLGMALAFYQLNLVKQTNYYLKFAIKSMHLCFKKNNKMKDFKQVIRFGLALVMMLFKTNQIDLSIQETKLLIRKLKQVHSFYCLCDLYQLIGNSYFKIDEKEKAAEYYDFAKQLKSLYSYSNFNKLNNVID